MFGAKARRLEREAEEKYRKHRDRLMLITEQMRLAHRRAEGHLSAGDYSQAATECHRAHQFELVVKELREVVWPHG